MISVSHLTKSFGAKVAIKDLSFEVAAGEIVGLLGPNAAGKTTTMRILTGFFPPSSGHATVAGLDVVEHGLEVRALVGYLPEHVPLYLEMTPREFLGFAASAKKVARKDCRRAVDKALERCDLTRVADQLIGTLSRGYRQRVGLGQAIINQPKVLILDEPTVGLDPVQVRGIRTLLREIARDSTVVLSSHILSEVSQLCARVVVLAGGELKAVGTAAELTANLRKQASFIVGVRGAPPDAIQEALQNVMGVAGVTRLDSGHFQVSCLGLDEEIEGLGPRLASLIVGNDWALGELRPVVASLEDIYLSLVAPKVDDHHDALEDKPDEILAMSSQKASTESALPSDEGLRATESQANLGQSGQPEQGDDQPGRASFKDSTTLGPTAQQSHDLSNNADETLKEGTP